MRFQAYYKGKKLGNPRTEKEKKRVEHLYDNITWVEVPDEEETK
ncbi:hypothetical protein [Paenibacillus sp. HJGM_3]